MGRHDTTLGLSEHADRDRADAEEASGNGRTGFLVKLTVRQVTIALGLAVTLAGGAVAVGTHEPKAEASSARASSSAAEPRAEALAAQLQAHDDELDQMKRDVRDTRAQVREMREDLRDALKNQRAMERSLGRLLARREAAGGGSK